jgi:hypothetical protein
VFVLEGASLPGVAVGHHLSGDCLQIVNQEVEVHPVLPGAGLIDVLDAQRRGPPAPRNRVVSLANVGSKLSNQHQKASVASTSLQSSVGFQILARESKGFPL